MAPKGKKLLNKIVFADRTFKTTDGDCKISRIR